MGKFELISVLWRMPPTLSDWPRESVAYGALVADDERQSYRRVSFAYRLRIAAAIAGEVNSPLPIDRLISLLSKLNGGD